MSSRRRLITGGHILTMDPSRGDLARGDILVADGRIVDIAPKIAADDAECIDASNGIVIPGLIDTHRHTWQSALRHRLGDETFLGYGCAMLRDLAPLYTPDDIYIGTLLGALSALEAGTTTLLDWSHALNTPAHADAAIAALREAGIRGIFAQGCPRGDGNNWTTNSTLPHPADLWRVRREVLYSDDALVTHAMAARGPEMTVAAVTRDDFKTARELGLRLSMHAGVQQFASQFRAIETMAADNLLGPDLTLIHVCASTALEMKLMADHGVSASIGPQTEMMMDGAGVPALGRLLNAGIKPSLSGDTETCATGDLFTQMRFALGVERMLTANRLLPELGPPVTVRNMLEFATVAGAAACGLETRVGSLTVGKDADLVVIRSTDLNLTPVTDPVGAVVLGAHPGNVDIVLVRGKPKKLQGRMVGLDLDRVRQKAAASRDRLLSAAPGHRHY